MFCEYGCIGALWWDRQARHLTRQRANYGWYELLMRRLAVMATVAIPMLVWTSGKEETAPDNSMYKRYRVQLLRPIKRNRALCLSSWGIQSVEQVPVDH